MKIDEIFTTADRDENNENFMHYFINAPLAYVHTPSGYKLKRYMGEHGDVKYGLFTSDEKTLISYASFVKDGEWYISSMPSTIPEYRKQGWMSLIFDFAINEDGLRIMSDDQQRPKAQEFWKSIASRGEFDVHPYNTITQQSLDRSSENDPYLPKNQATHRWVATPTSLKDKHIRESFGGGRGEMAAYRRLGVYDYAKYGPGTSNEELGFINW